MNTRESLHVCDHPDNFLSRFGEKRVESAYEVLGRSFLANPYAVRHPLFFGNGEFVHREYENGVLGVENVYLAAQGPLPVEVRGNEFHPTVLAFGVEGIPQHHEALCVVSPVVGKENPRRILHVAVEDHVHLVTQHKLGGAAWDMFDQSLVRIFQEGGAVVLLPECVRDWTYERMRETGRRVGSMVGIDSVSVLPSMRHEAIPNRALLGAVDNTALQRAVISACEYVLLPWSERPFTHIEVRDKTSSGDIHHMWIYGPVVGMAKVPFRPHSACSSSEIFGANNCDCPEQYDAAFQKVVSQGYGAVMYLDQEARGHGAVAKVGTWGLNIGHGVDLIQAFHAGGYEEDRREFAVVAEVLRWLRIESVLLLSNNVSVKQQGLRTAGVDIAGRMSVIPPPRSRACEIDHHAKVHKRGDVMDPNNAIPYVRPVLRRH